MDYPMFTADLGGVSQEHLNELKRLMEGQETTKHESFVSPYTIVERGLAEIPKELVYEITDKLSPLRNAQYVGCSIDILRAGNRIIRHSDLSAPTKNFYNCAHRHNLHIPVYTNQQSLVFHKRSMASPDSAIKSRHLKVGNAYLFNDYVHHWVHNDGDTDRIHVLFYYEDPLWEVKQDLLQLYKIRRDQYYEIL